MEEIKEQIKRKIGEVLLKHQIEVEKVELSYPALERGDLTTNVAMIAAKKAGVNPVELAGEIRGELEGVEGVDGIEIAGPGFINITVTDQTLLDSLNTIITDPEHVFKKEKDPNKKVVVEYSSPNIAKPFTIGHLRSTIIGDAIANILEANGWTVYRDNHVGDWGTQFGKQIYAIKAWGNEEELEKSENPIKELVSLYVKFHEEAEKDPTLEDKAREWFKKLEDGDKEARSIWEKTVDWSWKEFSRIYDELGVHFTENNGHGYGESFFEDKMQPVIEELRSKGLLKESEGAQIIEFSNTYPPLMIVKSDGASLYGTRDLATDKFRLEKYGNDVLVVVETGSEQKLYQAQVAEAEMMLNWYKKNQRLNITHGLYRFKDQKMSTRKGNVIWLEDVLKEAKDRAEQLSQNGSDESLYQLVSIGAIKWNDLKRSSHQDIVFDWDEILNMEGNSGPYMQYTYARTQSVLKKEEQISKQVPDLERYSLQKEERELLQLFSQYQAVVEDSGRRIAPNALATYLFELAQLFNLFYQKYPILKAEKKSVKDLRLLLTAATGSIIKNGLSLLGIQTPEKM